MRLCVPIEMQAVVWLSVLGDVADEGWVQTAEAGHYRLAWWLAACYCCSLSQSHRLAGGLSSITKLSSLLSSEPDDKKRT